MKKGSLILLALGLLNASSAMAVTVDTCIYMNTAVNNEDAPPLAEPSWIAATEALLNVNDIFQQAGQVIGYSYNVLRYLPQPVRDNTWHEITRQINRHQQYGMNLIQSHTYLCHVIVNDMQGVENTLETDGSADAHMEDAENHGVAPMQVDKKPGLIDLFAGFSLN